MQKACLSLVFAGWFFSLSSGAATFQEDFSSEPANRGWRVSGQTNLFNWNAAGGDLEVKWDSSQTNSYYYHPLGTVLGKADDFGLEFDLRLIDIATGTKSGPFEIAVGFLNLQEATAPSFRRGSGVDPIHGPRDLVELDYFPAGYYPDFGDVAPSFSPTIVSADNDFASGFDLSELATNDWFHIALTYSASDQTLHTTITRNGTPFGPIADVTLGTNFDDFHVDTLAISSYSDAGDDFDSVLAHGVVDNIVVTTPTPPVTQVTGQWSSGQWQIRVNSQLNWLYSLERTTDFVSWQTLPGGITGSGSDLLLLDTNPPPMAAFYRVRAARP